MPEITLQEVYQGLSERMDTISDELVNVRRGMDSVAFRVGSIESNMVDVELVNGGGRTIKQPRQQLIQQAYDYVKTGGVLDQRFAGVMLELKSDSEELEKNLTEEFKRKDAEILNKISECRSIHNPEAQAAQTEKKWDKAWKWGTRATLVIIAIATIILAIDWAKIVNK